MRPQQQEVPPQSSTLEVDFLWKKFNTSITSKDSNESKPLYIVGFKTLKSQLTFKSASDNSTFGTGTLQPISIDTSCTLRGQPLKLKAQKRFKIEYEYSSKAFSETDGEEVPMTWVCDTGFKTWSFVCLDRMQMPVARFEVNIWALKKIGVIELLGMMATDERRREEVVVTGVTLFYFTVLRSSNVCSLLGAVFSRPGKDSKDKDK